MKKLALINSYCNTWDKLTILHDNILKLKELGIDSLVYSPLPLPKEITEIADYTFITKENPIIYWPERGITHWKNLSTFTITLIAPDYGWASIYQYKKLMEIGFSFDYDYYFPLIYDLNLDTEVTKILNTPHKKMFFPSNKSKSSKVGGIFMSLSKENLNKLFPLINKQHYLEVCENTIAEKYIEFLCDSVNGEVNPHITTDIMNEHESLNFNVLNNQYPFKLALDNKKLLFGFYDLPPTTTRVTFSINGLHYDFDLTLDNNLVNFNLDINSIKSVVFYYKNNPPLDLTQHFNNSINIIRLIKTH